MRVGNGRADDACRRWEADLRLILCVQQILQLIQINRFRQHGDRTYMSKILDSGRAGNQDHTCSRIHGKNVAASGRAI